MYAYSHTLHLQLGPSHFFSKKHLDLLLILYDLSVHSIFEVLEIGGYLSQRMPTVCWKGGTLVCGTGEFDSWKLWLIYAVTQHIISLWTSSLDIDSVKLQVPLPVRSKIRRQFCCTNIDRLIALNEECGQCVFDIKGRLLVRWLLIVINTALNDVRR